VASAPVSAEQTLVDFLCKICYHSTDLMSLPKGGVLKYGKEVYRMRMRKKRHLEDRLAACKDVMIYMQNQNEHADDPLDEALFFDSMKVFGINGPLHLEIGSGKGAFILELARRNPDINYIAIEKTPNVIVTGAENLMESGIKNVRFCLGQAEYLEHLFHPHTIDRLYLNFSCPFPKESYAKHRLTHTRFLTIYNKVLKSGAEIHQKTDNKRLFEFSIEHFSANGFVMKNVSLDLHNSGFEGNIMTEYETRFTEMGLPIYRMEAVNP